SHSFVWSRPRIEGDPLDWRKVDPEGVGFRLLSGTHPVERLAQKLTDQLGITLSAQDWLETDDGHLVFLEANPSGQWLFLDSAESVLLPALVAHLERGEASFA